MALINGSNGVPTTNNKVVAPPKIQSEPVKATVVEPAPSAESYKDQPSVTKVVNSKKKKN
jgi:hypothetical protein|tara:strand:+ start:3065 stop:3244 length:180 start_codon:yes stop_codon:yes gene_type:complete